MNSLPQEAWWAIGLAIAAIAIVAIFAVARGRGFRFQLARGDNKLDLGIDGTPSGGEPPPAPGAISDVAILKGGKVERSPNTTIQVGHRIEERRD